MDLLDEYRLSSLKEIVVSGSHFGAEIHEAISHQLPHILILNGYGMPIKIVLPKLCRYIFYNLTKMDNIPKCYYFY